MIYDINYNSIFTSDIIKQNFLADCSSLYSTQSVSCIYVRPGSVIVTYEGLPQDLDIVFNQQIADGHLQVTDFPQMPSIRNFQTMKRIILK